MNYVYLDANIILRFLTGDIPEKTDAAAALFEQIERNEVLVFLTDIVIAEVVHVLLSQHHYHKTRQEIRALLAPILLLTSVKMTNCRAMVRALDIFVDYPIDLSDAYIKAMMEMEKVTILYSFDTDFDRFSDITRKEPTREKRVTSS